MKVAVSIPDAVFERAEALAKRLNLSRSRVYANALSAFVADHAESDLTAAMNAAVDAVGDQNDEFVRQAARRVFERVEW